jgi:transcriptional regulator with XRE-family HTH domain
VAVLLRQWRTRRRLSLHALADEAGVHFVTIVKIEQGRMSPTVALLEKLAAALEIRVRDFFPADEWPARRRSKKGGRR